MTVPHIGWLDVSPVPVNVPADERDRPAPATCMRDRRADTRHVRVSPTDRSATHEHRHPFVGDILDADMSDVFARRFVFRLLGRLLALAGTRPSGPQSVKGPNLTRTPKCMIRSGKLAAARRSGAFSPPKKLVRTAWVPLQKRLALPHRPHLRSRAKIDTSRPTLAERPPPSRSVAVQQWPWRGGRAETAPQRRLVP